MPSSIIHSIISKFYEMATPSIIGLTPLL